MGRKRQRRALDVYVGKIRGNPALVATIQIRDLLDAESSLVRPAR